MPTDHLPTPLDRLNKRDQLNRTVKGGETLFVQNKSTGGLYYLVSGIIDLTRTTHDGHSIAIHRARPRDTFAEASLFSETYHCSAIARGDSQVIECSRSAVEHFLNTDTRFARDMASRFAHQIQQCRRHVELLSIRAADERILVAIRDGLLVEDITSFADTIGLAPETVYRALAQLSKSGRVVKTARGRYQLVP